MFEREADWSNATTLICDVLRGSSTLAVETRHSGDSTDGRVAHFSSWAYEQTQPHGFVSDSAPRLFSIDHLRNTLGKMSEAENLFVYETSFDLHLGDVSEALSEFSSINVSVVKLTVGSVVLSWMLVSLDHPRDLILWKMRYHLRGASLTGHAASPAEVLTPQALSLDNLDTLRTR